MQEPPFSAPEVYVFIRATPAEFDRLGQAGVLDDLLIALGKTGPAQTTLQPDRRVIVTDGILVTAQCHGKQPASPSLDLRVNALPGLRGVFNPRVKAAVYHLVDRLGLGAGDLQFDVIPGFPRINMDALRAQYGDQPAKWPSVQPPTPVWLIRKRGVFAQIRLMEAAEVPTGNRE